MDLIEEGNKVIVLHVEEPVVAIIILCQKCLLFRRCMQVVPIVVVVDVAWTLVVYYFPGVTKLHYSFGPVRSFQLSCRNLYVKISTTV